LDILGSQVRIYPKRDYYSSTVGMFISPALEYFGAYRWLKQRSNQLATRVLPVRRFPGVSGVH
jgi:hypothetical protein